MDFRFTSNAAWLRLPADPVVRGVTAGQARDLQALIDLTKLSPGHYEAIVEVECDNCGWFVFKSCRVDKYQIHFAVDIAPAAGPPPGQPPAANAPVDPNDPKLPPTVRDQLKAALAARDDALKVQALCDVKLAELRDAAAKARAAADAAAKADADAAAAEQKKNEALEAARKAGEAAEKAANEAEALKPPPGINESQDYIDAKAAADKAEAERKKAVADAVAAQTAANEARRVAAKTDAAATAQAAAAAAAAVAAKEKEYEMHAAEAKAAADAAAAAEQAARDALNPEPPKAAAAGPTPEEIEAQRLKVQHCNDKIGETIEDQRRALEALAETGGLRDQDTPKGFQSDLDAWGDAVKKAQDRLGKIPPVVGGPARQFAKSALQLVGGIVRIVVGGIRAGDRANYTPNERNHDTIIAWLLKSGRAADKAQAERIYKQMENYTNGAFGGAARSTEGFKNELERLGKECDAEQKKLEDMQKAAGSK